MMIHRRKTDNYIIAVMIKLNFFPKKQSTCIAYSSNTVKSKLFQSLYIQISPRNTFASRLARTKAVLYVRSFFKTFVEVPNEASQLGLIKASKAIFFEFNNNEPVFVWKKEDNNAWEKSVFLGYPLISEYTLKEFNTNKKTIQQALEFHWNAVHRSTSNIHGDLTHFNILHNEKGELFFIDKKDSNHSKLFDFFYFYAYYKQNLFKCRTLSLTDKNVICKNLEDMLKSICIYQSTKEFQNDCLHFNIPKSHGLEEVASLQKDFIQIFKH